MCWVSLICCAMRSDVTTYILFDPYFELRLNAMPILEGFPNIFQGYESISNLLDPFAFNPMAH
jgi:hypothetical protein